MKKEELEKEPWYRIERFWQKHKIKILAIIGFVLAICTLIDVFYDVKISNKLDELLGARVQLATLNGSVDLGVLNFAGSVGALLEEAPTTRIPILKTPTSPFIFTLAYDIIECESNWNPKAIGKAGEIGLAQFMPKTWEWLSYKLDFKGDIYNPADQVRLLILALENGYESHWTCYYKVAKK